MAHQSRKMNGRFSRKLIGIVAIIASICLLSYPPLSQHLNTLQLERHSAIPYSSQPAALEIPVPPAVPQYPSNSLSPVNDPVAVSTTSTPIDAQLNNIEADIPVQSRPILQSPPTGPPLSSGQVDNNEMGEFEWITSSFMDHPVVLDYKDQPGLLDTHYGTTLNVLIVNDHWGVENEIHSVIQAVVAPLGVSVNFTHVMGVAGPYDSGITEEKAKKFFFENRHYCDHEQFDLIVIGDVISYSRAFLHAQCKANVILYVTQRFDFGLWGNKEYRNLLQAASRWPNVRLLINNLWEPYYAKKFAQTDLHVYAYAPSTGVTSPTAADILKESQVDWAAIGLNEWTIVNRPNQNIFVEMCRNRRVNCARVISSWHGGPLGIANRTHVHIPYQVNTMSLFENLSNGVIYILPSSQLYKEWTDLGLFVIDGAGEAPKHWTDEELLGYVDWWRRDLQSFFFHFDDISDLDPEASFHQMVIRESARKREHIRRYMEHHVNRSVEAWRQALQSFPRLSVSRPTRKLDPITREKLLVANLPPAVPDAMSRYAV